MTEDIVARLRATAFQPYTIRFEAADEIDRLRGEVEQLTRERDWHKSLTQSHDLLADNAAQKTRAEAAEAKVARLREALQIMVKDMDERGIRHDDFRQQRARTALQETE